MFSGLGYSPTGSVPGAASSRVATQSMFLGYIFRLIFMGLLCACCGGSWAAPPNELAQLRDIHLPQPVGWWPLAPGWYVLAILVLLMLCTLGYMLRRYYLNGQGKRQALLLITLYQQQHERDANSQLTSARVSELLKRVALVYFPRERVASLQGERWLAFLNETGKGVNFNLVRYNLLEQPYHPHTGHDNLHLLFSMAKKWISQRGKPCLN